MKNKEYNLVTLEELEALYEKADGLRKDLPMDISLRRTALEKHLIAERLLQKDFDETDWSKECSYPFGIMEYARLWMNPLVWKDPLKFKGMLIDGRIAIEELYRNIDDRYFKIRDIVGTVYEQGILAFADNPSVNKENDLEYGIVKGVHNWYLITKDYKNLLEDMLIGIDKTNDDLKYYDSFRLQNNLMLIADNRSPKRAAELLRMLQDEWPKIKRWKTGFDSMTEEEIAEFEQELFHGFDDMLEEWENNPDPSSPKQTAANNQDGPFKYIHYSVVDETERENIHKSICNIVRLPKMAQVCDALCDLMKNQKVLTTIERTCMLEELRRLGLPDANTPGFSDQNFYSYYHTK